MKSRVSYLAEIDNLISIYGYKSSKEFNNRFMDLMNLKNNKLKKFVNVFSPFIKIFNFCISLVRVFASYVYRFVYAFKPKNNVYPKDVFLFLDISIFLVARSKAASLFEKSEFWVRSKYMKPVGDLSSKTILYCEDYLTPSDCVWALLLSLKDIISYLFKYNCIYPVYKSYYYYCVYLSLEKLVEGNTILFSNQCDRWALMFDALPAKSKILLQHGLAHPSQVYLYKLKNIDIFYSISKQTWQVPYKVNLDCIPELRLMNPTIDIKPIKDNKFTLFIIAHPLFFDLEKKIIKELSSLDISIYIKTHPTVRNINNYNNLCKKYGVNLVDYFPKTKYAISYYSTLAFEYMAADIPVYLYDKIENFVIEDVKNEIQNQLNKY